MIRAEQLTKSYGGSLAVDDVNFHIGQGEIVGLLGHNGAGKTTVMKMLTGYLEPSAGKITIANLDIETEALAAQALIGYLPENLPIYPEMRVLDYLQYCAALHSVASEHLNERLRYALEKTELQERALSSIATLSRGYKQRVGVAQALLHHPKILILDEPTNGLDPHQTQQMRKLIVELAKHATIILSTHIMQEVDALCDRVLILEDGKLLVDQELEALKRVNSIQVTTSAQLQHFENAINNKPTQLSTAESGKHNIFEFGVDKHTDIDALCTSISETVIKSGEQLFALEQKRQDLDTVFRGINKKLEKAS